MPCYIRHTSNWPCLMVFAYEMGFYIVGISKHLRAIMLLLGEIAAKNGVSGRIESIQNEATEKPIG